jgi:hypothetical protein
MARAEGFAPSPDDAEIVGNDGPVVGTAPTAAGAAGRAVGRMGSRVARGPVMWAAAEAADGVRTAGLLVHEVAGDLPADVAAVARGMGSSMPGDVTVGTAQAAAITAGAAAPLMRAVADRAFGGVPSPGGAAAAGAGWVAGFMARLASGDWLDGSGWVRLGHRLPRLPGEQWSDGRTDR